jgi:signal transduction histidine kinase
MKSKSDRVYHHGGFWAFLIVLVVSYAQVFLIMGGPLFTAQTAAFVGCGLLYCGCGVFWFSLLRQQATLVARLCYIGVQMPLVALILFLSPVPGNIGLVVFPLMSQTVFLFPRVLVGLFSALLFVLTLAHLAAPYGWTDAYRFGLGFAAATSFVIVFSYVVQREERARKEAETLTAQLEEANRKLRDAAAQAEELAVARERNRLAREIHDGLGHYLTTIAVQLEAAQALLGGSPSPAADAVGKAGKLSQEALADVRRSVGALRVDAPRSSLMHELEQLALADPQLMVAVTVRGTARDLPPAIEHAFFRVAQEGLTNVRKHAGASEVQLILDFLAPTQVRLEVVDNGGGPAAGEPGAGFGLNGVRERIELLGGRMEAAARPKGGFALHVEVPG